MHSRKDILEQKEQILKWIKEEKSKTFIAAQLNCKIETLTRWLKWLNIDYAGQQNKKGQKKGTNVYKPSSYYTDEQTPRLIAANTLRKKLIKDGIKEAKCEECGLTHWKGVPIPLELHHLDGCHTNNRLSNLKIVCPNCHAIKHITESTSAD